jgi:hypothetical protein
VIIVYRQKVLSLFVSLKANLESSTDRDSAEMELLMFLAESLVFVEYRATAEALAQGVTTRVTAGFESGRVDRSLCLIPGLPHLEVVTDRLRSFCTHSLAQVQIFIDRNVLNIFCPKPSIVNAVLTDIDNLRTYARLILGVDTISVHLVS